MCGRFLLTASPEEVEAICAAIVEAFPPRYNIAPTQPILMVVAGPPALPGSNMPERRAMLVRWGFLPGWVKDTRGFPLLINARSETAVDKAAFRAAMRHRRTLVPASGFFEWRRSGKGRAQAYFVRPRQGGLVCFAGLMETFAEPGGSEIDTGAILTTTATGELARIHDRMPVVIRPQDFERWLDCRSQEPRHVADLLRPVEPDFFEAIPVSDRVNKVDNADPDILERVAETAEKRPEPEPRPLQGSLF